MKKILFSFLFITTGSLQAQNNTSYWQQHVDYTYGSRYECREF